MCNNAPLGVVLAAISIKSKLILNNEGRQKSFTWPHYGKRKSYFTLENKGLSFYVFAFGSFSAYVSIQIGNESFL